MRTLEAWGSWRSEDLGGAGTRFIDMRSLKKTGIVCYLKIEDHGGVWTRLIDMRSLIKTN